ncbi:MAG: nucleoside transporter C-terminal domain-containing protein [Sedimentisphaerales bacterium]|nr:nucleoside transporter C-terminal domain-containing protein [Sedimentisphaerales bacterium]
MTIYNLVSLAGIFILAAICWALSTNHRLINWRVVVGGIGIQLLVGLLVFRAGIGVRAFYILNDGLIAILERASEGTRFVFGPLAVPSGQAGSLGFILAFQGLPTIIFFSALIAILYHIGLMQLLIRSFAYCFHRLLRVSGAESLVAASNIFVGVESVLTVRPYLAEMTRSELCTVLTAGMATVASNVLAIYVITLKGQFPAIAGHIVSASILSAPAAIVASKLIWPEDGRPRTMGIQAEPFVPEQQGLFESIINGANAGVRMVVGIVALLIAVLGLVSVIDLGLTRLGHLIGLRSAGGGALSLKGLCACLFYPLTIIVGVPLSDAWQIARIIGQRLIVTEVPAYQELATVLANGLLHYPQRSAVIATYALCGFAHLASIAIFAGGISAIAPNRTADVARVSLRALVAAAIACMMTAAVAGAFFTGDSILFGRPGVDGLANLH